MPASIFSLMTKMSTHQISLGQYLSHLDVEHAALTSMKSLLSTHQKDFKTKQEEASISSTKMEQIKQFKTDKNELVKIKSQANFILKKLEKMQKASDKTNGFAEQLSETLEEFSDQSVECKSLNELYRTMNKCKTALNEKLALSFKIHADILETIERLLKNLEVKLNIAEQQQAIGRIERQCGTIASTQETQSLRLAKLQDKINATFPTPASRLEQTAGPTKELITRMNAQHQLNGKKLSQLVLSFELGTSASNEPRHEKSKTMTDGMK